MTLRISGAAAVLSIATAVLASQLALAWSLAVLLVALGGLSGWLLWLERAQAKRACFLSGLPRELLGCRDVEAVWERSVAALGSFLEARRVVLYRCGPEGDYRLWIQWAAEDVRPLDAEASLPVPGATPYRESRTSDRLIRAFPGQDGAESLAIAIHRARIQESFLESFHDVTRQSANAVAHRVAHARLSELRGALLQLAHALASTQELEAVLDLAVTATVPLARSQGGAVFLDNGASGFRTAAEYGLDKHVTPAVLSHLLPSLDEAASARAPVEVEVGGVGHLVVPLYHGRELMGVWLFARQRSGATGAWDESDLEAVRIASQLTATSIKNATRLEELVGSAAQAEGLAELTFDLLATIDEQGVIQGCNRRVAEVLGVPPADLEGRRFDELLDRKSARSFRARVGELFRRGSLRGERLCLINREGEPIAVVLNADAFSPSAAHLVMKDVSEAMSLCLQLQQSQKQEVLGLLASGIAHDLNNVLGGVMGYASLARRKSEDPLFAKYVGTIERTAMRGASLTGRLLSASRKSGLQHEPVSLNQLAQETLAILSHSFPKDIAIETRLDPAVGSMMADPGQLQQLLLNLCVNARDAMKHGGVLRLSTRFNATDERVQLTIEDDGVGMDGETLERLFEPFFSTKGAAGTGLGLSVVSNIVSSLSGEIRVQSAPGKGSRFEVLLPCLRTDDAPRPSGVHEPAGKGELVLLVDDEQVMRELGRDILEAEGYRVEAVASGEAAIRFLRLSDEIVSLVVLDLVMPGVDGSETYRRLRTLRRDLPVLLSSGLSAEDAVSELLRDPKTAFLGKPYSTEELARAVETAIATAKSASAVVH